MDTVFFILLIINILMWIVIFCAKEKSPYPLRIGDATINTAGNYVVVSYPVKCHEISIVTNEIVELRIKKYEKTY